MHASDKYREVPRQGRDGIDFRNASVDEASLETMTNFETCLLSRGACSNVRAESAHTFFEEREPWFTGT